LRGDEIVDEVCGDDEAYAVPAQARDLGMSLFLLNT
jgi:hypothetical protein